MVSHAVHIVDTNGVHRFAARGMEEVPADSGMRSIIGIGMYLLQIQALKQLLVWYALPSWASSQPSSNR